MNEKTNRLFYFDGNGKRNYIECRKLRIRNVTFTGKSLLLDNLEYIPSFLLHLNDYECHIRNGNIYTNIELAVGQMITYFQGPIIHTKKPSEEDLLFMGNYYIRLDYKIDEHDNVNIGKKKFMKLDLVD